MNLSTITLSAITALLFSGCQLDGFLESLQTKTALTNTTNEQDSTPLIQESKHIRFIELNDLHANLVAHNELRRENNSSHVERLGGIAKIATRIKALRQENENSVLMNIGDTFHGGAEATFSVGNAIVDSVNALHVDVGVVGNWDFAYGPAVTKLRFTDEKPFKLLVKQSIGDTEIKKVNYEVIAANWFNSSFSPSDDYMTKPTTTITKDGVKIGFIGLTSDIVERMHKGFALGMSFTQGKENYINIINTFFKELKNEGCEIVVVMSELGIHKDVALANNVNSGVDVFFSAHTHEVTPKPITSKSGALVVESGDDTYLGVMDVAINEKQEKSFSWNIEEITQDIVDDEVVANIVQKDRAPFLAQNVNIKNPLKQSTSVLSEPINKVLAYSEINLNRQGLLENSFNTAFTDLLMQETNTELALTPGFRFDSVIDTENDFETNGEIKVSDVYRFFPSSFTLSTAEIDGKRLKEIYEQMLHVVVSKDHFEQNGGWVEKLAGVNVKVNIENSDNARLLEMKLKSDDSTISDDALYSITGCTRPFDDDEELCSYMGFKNKEPFINPTSNEAYNVTEFFIDALKRDVFHPISHNDVVDESSINLNEGFIQPLWE